MPLSPRFLIAPDLQDRTSDRNWKETLQSLQNELKTWFAGQQPDFEVLTELFNVEIGGQQAAQNDDDLGSYYFSHLRDPGTRCRELNAVIVRLNERLPAYFRSRAGQNHAYLISITDDSKCRRLQINENPLEPRFVFAEGFQTPTDNPNYWCPALQALRDTLKCDLPRNNRSLPILLDLFAAEIRGKGPLNDHELGARHYRDTLDPVQRLGNVRAAVLRLNRRVLGKYFGSSEGRAQAYKVSIAEGPLRRLQIDRNVLTPPNSMPPFWNPYLGKRKHNAIVFTEPLFYRKKGALVYVRHVDCNEDDNPHADPYLGPLFAGSSNWERSYHYMSSGEVWAILQLVTALSFGSGWPPPHQGAATSTELTAKAGEPFRCDFLAARTAPPLNQFNASTNLIVIGSGRTNPLLLSLQHNQDIVVGDSAVEVRRPTAGEQSEYKDQLEGPNIYKYAVLTRTVEKERTIVQVAANHGRAAQAIVEEITREDRLVALYCYLLAPQRLPEHFQVVYRVEISRHAGQADILGAVPIAKRVRYSAEESARMPTTCPKCGQGLTGGESHYWFTKCPTG